jgi:hypothetical protein
MSFQDALDYEFAENVKEQGAGKFAEVSWLTIDGVKGMFTRDEKSKAPGDLQHLKWKCYRVYKGEHQILEFSIFTSSEAFDRNAGEMKELLDSLKLAS